MKALSSCLFFAIAQGAYNPYGSTNTLSGSEPLGPVVYGQVPGHFETRAVTTQVANPALPQPVTVLPSPTPFPYIPILPAPTPRPYIIPYVAAPTPLPYIAPVQPAIIPYRPAPVIVPAPTPRPVVPVVTYGVTAPVVVPAPVPVVKAPVKKIVPRKPRRVFFDDYDYDDKGFDLAAATFFHYANGCTKDTNCDLGSIAAGLASYSPLQSLALAALRG